MQFMDTWLLVADFFQMLIVINFYNISFEGEVVRQFQQSKLNPSVAQP
jgi:hypothetical protein